MALDGTEYLLCEVADKEADDVFLSEDVLALGILGDGPRDDGLDLHGPVLEDLAEGGADSGVDEAVNALLVAAEEAECAGGILLPLRLAILDQAEEGRGAVLFDDELGEVLVVAGEGDEVGGRLGSGVRVAGLERGDVAPDEGEDGLVLGDGAQAVEQAVVVSSGRGDAEEPGDIGHRVVDLDEHLGEGGTGGDAEEAVHEDAVAAAVDKVQGLIEDLLGVIHDEAGGALAELGPGGLAEEGRELVRPRLQLQALLLVDLGPPSRLAHLIRQLDQLRQHLLRPLRHFLLLPTL
ncbi:hypothetical protein C4D60_Mb11t14490 [Musa balbisiana]|uniref:Uncharacterized protein n=1 Tax=Musa balbisiana TaxID=52838 RepID=A0A4V4H5I4_MUSBA|nr:hypothetical protein C4D60_Mb11t14490 [Musa balbisiana]